MQVNAHGADFYFWQQILNQETLGDAEGAFCDGELGVSLAM